MAGAWAQPVDILIKGGSVIDGSGAQRRTVDVAIRGDRIVFVGDAAREGIAASRTIDATGLVVSPGFIDPHTHTFADFQNEQHVRRQNAAYLTQGVTTVVTGNDGGGPIDVGGHLTRWGQRGIGTNVALYVGFGSVRSRVLGASGAAPTPAQLDQMRALVAEGMKGGALGLSTGLYYAPQSFSTTSEVIALAKVAADHGGIYDSHLRDESSYDKGLLESIREILEIGREAKLPVHIAHIKALGTDVWGKSDSVIALIRAARASGQRVTADQYPYTASGTAVGASLLPRWAQDGGRDSLRRRAADAKLRPKLLDDMRNNLRRRGGAASLLITERSRADLAGKTLKEIAAARGQGDVETALDIVLTGDASVASFNMDEKDIIAFMKADFVVTGSDGSDGHPRKYGTYPEKFTTYVQQKRVLSLEEAVKRSSADVAAALGIADRGRIAQGAYADVVLIDLRNYQPRATYQNAEALASGVRYALVNGRMAIDNGRIASVLAGRALRRGDR